MTTRQLPIYYKKSDGTYAQISYTDSDNFSKLTWQDVYPVGSIYISVINKSPANIFGGTWTKLTTGVLRAASDANSGSSDTVSIQHNHGLGSGYGKMEVKGTSYIDYKYKSTSSYSTNWCLQGTYNGTTGANATTGLELGGATDNGGSTSISRLPAYQNVHVWKRET